MKANEFRKLDVNELQVKMLDSKKQLFNLRMELATGNLEDTSQIRKIKSDVARMKMVIAEHEKKGQ